jgi:hypothetical protein
LCKISAKFSACKISTVVSMEKDLMLKQLILSTVCVGLWAIALPARAQTAAPAPAPAPANPAPVNPAPANPGPGNPGAAPSEAATPVSESEVEKFASAVKEFQSIQQEAQQQANQIIEGEDLSPERFSQILQTQQNPQAEAPAPEVSSEERQKFDQALEKLNTLQQDTRQRMDQALQTQGMERERFSQILAMVRQDATLRQRVEDQLKN